MISKALAALIAVLAFCVVIDVPKRYVPQAGFVGGIGWFLYLYTYDLYDKVWVATFVSGFIIALISHIFAKVYKAPVTIFLIAGIIPIVPGGQMYRSVYYILMSNADKAEYYIRESIQVAGAMALAIFVTDSIFKYIRMSFKKEKKYKVLKNSK